MAKLLNLFKGFQFLRAVSAAIQMCLNSLSYFVRYLIVQKTHQCILDLVAFHADPPPFYLVFAAQAFSKLDLTLFAQAFSKLELFIPSTMRDAV